MAHLSRILTIPHTRSLARFVELALEDADIVFSDSYFDLATGRSAFIICLLPEGRTPEHAADAAGALAVRYLLISGCARRLMVIVAAVVSTLTRVAGRMQTRRMTDEELILP